MLCQRLGLSLPTLKKLGWSPTDNEYLVAWYRYRTGISEAVNKVSRWDDQSSNNNHLVQATVAQQPTNGTADNYGTIDFDDTRPDNLDTTTQITLTADLTIGIRLNITTVGRTIIADNTSSNEFLKSVDATNLRFKFDGNTLDFALDDGTLGDGNLVVTRTSNEWEIWWNGVLQLDTETQAGTVLLDNVGVRKSDINPYDGTIKEIQIYRGASTELTADVINRLKSL